MGENAQIGWHYWFPSEKVNIRNKDKTYLVGIPIAWSTGGILTGGWTSSYACEIQAAFRCFGDARFLKISPSELRANENVDIETRIRNDNSIVVEHVHSINSVTKERRMRGLVGSNIEELDINQWLALSNIMGGLGISDEMARATT